MALSCDSQVQSQGTALECNQGPDGFMRKLHMRWELNSVAQSALRCAHYHSIFCPRCWWIFIVFCYITRTASTETRRCPFPAWLPECCATVSMTTAQRCRIPVGKAEWNSEYAVFSVGVHGKWGLFYIGTVWMFSWKNNKQLEYDYRTAVNIWKMNLQQQHNTIS